MQITLTPEQEQLIRHQLMSGVYKSADAVLDEALELLAKRDEFQRRRIEALDQFIQVGLDEAARGELLVPEEVEADIDQLFIELKQPRA